VPCTTLNPRSTPYVPPSTQDAPDIVRPRTSVGARPHVLEAGAGGIAAADDVDGAGGVDHGCVPKSASPRRRECAARPRDTCGPRAPTPADGPNRAHERAAADAPRAELLIPPVPAVRWEGPRSRAARTQACHTRKCLRLDVQNHKHKRTHAQTHAHTDARAHT
jgi:hypothetical protein